MSTQYDIIIVGGGAAGGMLANKLSQHLKVLLIEAGPNANQDTRVTTPSLARALSGSELDWNYQTEPEPGLGNRIITHPAGKLLGGSSAINSHVLAHSTRSLHDAWVELGNTDWSWEALEPYYNITNLVNRAPLPSGDYKTGGSISASFSQLHPLQKAWSDSFPHSVNGGPGAVMVANAIGADGKRSHSGNALVEPVQNRIKILHGQVTKVLFDGNQAIGVELFSELIYGKEIILCAGTFGSAKLLELSGIGRGQYIPSWLDLPVGENLQDHLNFSISVEVEGIDTMDDASTRDPTEGFTYSFIYHSLPAESLQDLQITDPFLSKVATDPEETTATLFMVRGRRYVELQGNYLSIITMYSYPLSRGSSKMHSSDVNDRPIILFSYLEDPIDLELFARHVLEADKLLEGPLKSYIKPDGIRMPIYDNTLDSVKQAIRQYARTNYHPCGTCSMKAKEKGGVVDQQLRVYGTKGLRVCDASVIPIIPRANILSTVYAIAGKAADMILAEHNQARGDALT